MFLVRVQEQGAALCSHTVDRKLVPSVHPRMPGFSLQGGRKEQFQFLVVLWGKTVSVLGMVVSACNPSANNGGRRIEFEDSLGNTIKLSQ